MKNNFSYTAEQSSGTAFPVMLRDTHITYTGVDENLIQSNLNHDLDLDIFKQTAYF